MVILSLNREGQWRWVQREVGGGVYKKSMGEQTLPKCLMSSGQVQKMVDSHSFGKCFPHLALFNQKTRSR